MGETLGFVLGALVGGTIGAFHVALVLSSYLNNLSQKLMGYIGMSFLSTYVEMSPVQVLNFVFEQGSSLHT